jgi:hypothetical protein
MSLIQAAYALSMRSNKSLNQLYGLAQAAFLENKLFFDLK